jgi:hypothetical protein
VRLTNPTLAAAAALLVIACVTGNAQVAQLPTAQAALLGRFSQGPINLPRQVDSAQFQTVFGSTDPTAWPAEMQARQFFSNGGSSLYIVRVRDSGPLGDALLGNATDLTGLHALEPLSDLRVLIAPELSLLPANLFSTTFAAFRDFLEARRIFFILDPPPGLRDVTAAINWVNASLPDNSPLCAIYYPYLEVLLDNALVTVTAGGAMAAVYQKNDASTGPWKSPAGTGFPLEANGITPGITDSDSDALIAQNINPIRTFPGSGVVPWGARTLDRSNGSSRYVAIGRTESWIAACIERWLALAAVADDNDTLWTQIRTNVENFLDGLYQDGAFQGNTPDKGFYVQCDSTTNSAADIAAHRVNVFYGVALIRSDEFDVTKLTAATYDSLRPIPLPSLFPRTLGGDVLLAYPTEPGFTYVLQSKTDLPTGGWINAAPISGDGAWRTPDLPISGPRAFYRLHIAPGR